VRRRTMRIWPAALLLLAASVSGDQAPPPAADLTLSGEVVDLHCYLTRGARGTEHAGCANACLSRGVTAGFRAEDGRLFVLLAERPVSAKETLAGLAGARVTLKGALVERDGMKALQVKSVERAPSS
jgi:hypothetical protein